MNQFMCCSCLIILKKKTKQIKYFFVQNINTNLPMHLYSNNQWLHCIHQPGRMYWRKIRLESQHSSSLNRHRKTILLHCHLWRTLFPAIDRIFFASTLRTTTNSLIFEVYCCCQNSTLKHWKQTTFDWMISLKKPCQKNNIKILKIF